MRAFVQSPRATITESPHLKLDSERSPLRVMDKNLTIREPGDRFEREADAIADRISTFSHDAGTSISGIRGSMNTPRSEANSSVGSSSESLNPALRHDMERR